MADEIPPLAGQKIARGVARALLQYDFASAVEFVPISGLRVDVMAIGPKGEIWVIECKSSVADFRADQKWHGYLDWCDRFFWAVGPDFPTHILPTESGLIFADAYGGEIVHMGPDSPLSPARRKALTLRFARTIAQRLQASRDSGLPDLLG
jgi:hypothetical protein